MNNIYYPDVWVLLEIEASGETLYKVLAGWYGGYGSGDSWRINSGIAKVEERDEYYVFTGESGSEYVCNKRAYKMSGLSGSIYSSLVEQYKDHEEINVSLVDKDTDFLTIV